MKWKDVALTGWGRTSTARTQAARAERRGEIETAFNEPGGEGLIAYGAGRSYGDVALNDGGRTMLTGRLDRMLAFDEATGLLVCEPGVTFKDLAETFLHRGFVAPVSPGTAFATMGGALANDVHGKNHWSAGSFGSHVEWFDLALPSGEVRRVSPDSDAELFDATVGGLGLTGIVTRLALRLTKVTSSNVVVREARAPNLAAMMERLVETHGRDTYSVAWIDALASGPSLGRGVVEAANHALSGFERGRPKRAKRLPVDLPGVVLNPASVGLFNALYYRRIPADGRERTVDFPTFLYPLDALGDWNRMYGKRGFFQFQCVLPYEEAEAGLRKLLEVIGEARSASFLAVLKSLGEAGRGMLSFPRPGFTLALDFPRRDGTLDLMARLERIVLDHGGRIYLAKDAALSAQGFRMMYPELPRFRAVLDRVDPDRRLGSDLSRRLGIRSDA
ncbi:FAD-binding oxidoreductase [Antarcticirhabdus aurantiaca]|uniref:FAD-binding oxidoreductase n=1 Tax=Antarcticirhabdus aurantiaca TaxID=2606717 RepID=A0ACD4NR76_9HYPH|nr:FAD-binding oxidoreductase [Antarcticirhabdus aurantiaca]WAJ29238.1 FAD-binding oxidoreductase [Jeongeuplla avenae]